MDEQTPFAAKALAKYKRLRSQRIAVAPVGRRLAFGEHGCIWTGISAFMAAPGFVAIGAGLLDSEVRFFVGVGCFLLVFSLICLLPSGIVRLAPISPDRAVRNFFEFIARNNLQAAWDMVSPLEKEVGGFPCHSYEEFRDYWRQARKDLKLRAGKLFFESVEYFQLDTDLVRAQFQLNAEGNAIILPAPIVAGVIQLGGNSYALSKIVVRHGDEWFMWCGEFIGAEESDVSWFDSRA